jgi:hypothetical protein
MYTAVTVIGVVSLGIPSGPQTLPARSQVQSPETATSGTRFAGSPDAVTRCFSGPTKPCTPQTAPIGLFHFLSPSSSSPAPSYSSVESPVNPAPIFVAFHARFYLIAASVVFRWNTVMGQGDWSLGKRALGRNSCF